MELVIKNELREIQTLGRFVESFANQHGLPPQPSLQINLALEELVTNIISYGYSDHDEHEIHIKLELERDRLLAVIEDDARPFNPLEFAPPDLDVPLEQRPVGGLGIHLVKNMFDTLEYRREQDKNRLIMHKNNVMLDTA